MDINTEIDIVNRICALDKEIKVLKALIAKQNKVKKGYVCRFCGKKTNSPSGGKCPYSPHQNKTHEFIAES